MTPYVPFPTLPRRATVNSLLVTLVSLVLVLPLSATSLLAQDATPTGDNPFAELGLPTLDITVTASGYEGIPASLNAGRYLVTVTVGEDTAEREDSGVAFIQPIGADGNKISGPDFIEYVDQQLARGAGRGFYYESLLAGGAYAGPGQTVQVVLDLPPGEWVVWSDNPNAPQTPVAFEVSGEMPQNLPDPEASATLTMGEYEIEVTEGDVVPGSQVLRVDNIGIQPHHISGASGPTGLTDADVEALLQADLTGTPATVDFDWTAFSPVFITAPQSTGTSMWVSVANVPAGALLLVCFFPDQGDRMPHLLHGMYTVLEVGD
jgi:hypothetical protein